jgi:hypothetical protein
LVNPFNSAGGCKTSEVDKQAEWPLLYRENDPFYNEDAFTELHQNTNLTLNLIQGADHSLLISG